MSRSRRRRPAPAALAGLLAVAEAGAGALLRMPELAFGTGDAHCSPDCASAVAAALQAGFRHVDTAYEYGSQLSVAEGLRRSGLSRSEVFLTTKIPGPVGSRRAEELLHQGLHELNTTYLDLLLMHYPCDETWPDPRDACDGADGAGARLETWRAMEGFVAGGLVRSIGVSNFHVRHLQRLLQPSGHVTIPSVNQVEWHLGWHDEALMNYTASVGIRLQAYSPLGGGGTTTGHNGGIALDDPVVARIAGRHARSEAQVALRWSLERGVALVTATTKPSHMISDLEVLDFSLFPEEVRALSDLRAEVPSVQILDAWPDVTMPVVGLAVEAPGPAPAAWLRLGGRYLEAAPGAEAAVGHALNESIVHGVAARDEVFVAAKVPGPLGYAGATEHFLSRVLPALSTPYVDLLLLAWPCPGASPSSACGADGAAQRAETWRALEDLRSKGKARSVGVAGFSRAHLEALLPHVRNASLGNTSSIAVNQVEWHLGWHDDDLLGFCRAQGIHLQARWPLGGPGAEHPTPPEEALAPLRAAAAAHNATAAQAALRWSLQRGVPVIVPPTPQLDDMRQDLSPLFRFSLSAAELRALDGLGAGSAEAAGGLATAPGQGLGGGAEVLIA